jgi:hypothetical protein
MMALLSGSVPISVPSPDGKEIVLAILQPRDIFGLIALLDRKERCAALESVNNRQQRGWCAWKASVFHIIHRARLEGPRLCCLRSVK